jgi:alpha-1,3-rhamnosyltransferase
MNHAKDSVCIAVPCYNHGAFITDTIKSIVGQWHNNIELIIIDDGSTDDSVSRINELIPVCKERFTRFEFRKRSNRGVCATLNEALAWCQSDYFAPIASDDLLKAHKTSLQVAHMAANTSCAGVFGEVEVIDRTGKTLARPRAIKSNRCRTYHFNDIFLHKHNLPAPSQMLRSKSLRDIGGYIEGLVIEDWSLWLLLAHSGFTLDRLSGSVACYRQHDNNNSKKFDLMLDGRLQVLQLFRQNSLYKQALARVFLVDALDRQQSDLSRSLQSLRSSLDTDWRIMTSPMFLQYLFRTLRVIVK